MPKAYPKEFREDVIRVARQGDASIEQVAKDFGVADSCLRKWLKQADVEDGKRPGVSRQESEELRELRKRLRLVEQENEVLRKAAAYLSQANLSPKMMYPLVRELAARDPETRIPITVTCRVLGFKPQSYYKWLKKPVSDRELEDAYLSNAAVDVHADDPEFGYRFIYDELVDAGHPCGENRVQRLCSRRALFSVHSRKRGKGRRPGPPVHDDLVGRDFSASRPDEKWLTDITEHPTAEGKLYMCAVRDCYSGRIVGYSIDSRMKASLAVTALRNAIALRRPIGTIVHSDRGSQFRSRKYVNALSQAKLVGSMGRVGAAGDNAAIESFFALLQKNVLNRKRWQTREELRLAIVTWVERTYHRRRRQRRLGRLTPVEFEMIHTVAHAA